MSYRKRESADAVVLEPPSTADAAVIWLHGLGADGHDFVPIVPELRLPASLQARFVFPHAPLRPVTINNGYTMRAWYDIVGISLAAREDEAGIRDSENRVRALVQREVDGGIPASRIVIAGFSQGGAIALQTALRYPQRLAGVMALSTYLPLRGLLREEAAAANRDIPILMCHGRDDVVVPMSLGTLSRDALTALNYDVDWSDFQMGHEVCMEEIDAIAAWLTQVLAAS
jgi:phospholipase/carboxylesterase